MTHRHPGHVEPEIRPTGERTRPPARPRAGSPSPWRFPPPSPYPAPRVTHGRQVSLVVSDRRHWQMDAWRLNISRWCPGETCQVPASERLPERHWLRVRLWRRSWSARYSEPPEESALPEDERYA